MRGCAVPWPRRRSRRAPWACTACPSSSSTAKSRSRGRSRPRCCSRRCSKPRRNPPPPDEAMDRPPSNAFTVSFHPRAGDGALARRLAREIEGEVLFDRASRGRYSTDASIYQIDPVGVVVPRTGQDARIAMQIATEEAIPILPRGAGSSQCGQAVGAALVIDHTKYLNRIVEADGERAVVQPGIVLDALNAALRPKGVWFPVDVSTSAQATLGGMAGNNSCGSRSIAYGNMVHNVLAIEACTVSGERWKFGPMDDRGGPAAYQAFLDKLKALYQREREEIERRFPKVLRKVAGYN